jgi:hypothetical protein
MFHRRRRASDVGQGRDGEPAPDGARFHRPVRPGGEVERGDVLGHRVQARLAGGEALAVEVADHRLEAGRRRKSRCAAAPTARRSRPAACRPRTTSPAPATSTPEAVVDVAVGIGDPAVHPPGRVERGDVLGHRVQAPDARRHRRRGALGPRPADPELLHRRQQLPLPVRAGSARTGFRDEAARRMKAFARVISAPNRRSPPPPPNYFTGASNFHSRFEFLPVPAFAASYRVTRRICGLAAGEGSRDFLRRDPLRGQRREQEVDGAAVVAEAVVDVAVGNPELLHRRQQLPLPVRVPAGPGLRGVVPGDAADLRRGRRSGGRRRGCRGCCRRYR